MISPANAATLLHGVSGNKAGASSMSGVGQVKDMSTDQVDKVSKDFESMFVSQMLEQMFGDSLGAEAFGDRETTEVYKAMMVEEYGKQISNAGGIGIAAYIKQELLKLQEI